MTDQFPVLVRNRRRMIPNKEYLLEEVKPTTTDLETIGAGATEVEYVVEYIKI